MKGTLPLKKKLPKCISLRWHQMLIDSNLQVIRNQSLDKSTWIQRWGVQTSLRFIALVYCDGIGVQRPHLSLVFCILWGGLHYFIKNKPVLTQVNNKPHATRCCIPSCTLPSPDTLTGPFWNLLICPSVIPLSSTPWNVVCGPLASELSGDVPFKNALP